MNSQSLVRPDPKPARRIKDTTAGTEKVRREGRCRCCGLSGIPTKDGGQLNRAHLVPRSQGGDDVDANLIPLCGSGTTGCHGAFDGQIPKTAEPSLLPGMDTAEVRERVWSRLSSFEERYLIDKKGTEWIRIRFLSG